jgi:uncharacterized protein YbjT (DUF2867 family)
MKVLAVGAAGASAGLVTQALSAKGVEVRGLVHSAQRQAVARENGATETVVADLDDKAALVAALGGIDGVFHVVPAFVPDEAATGLVMVEAAVEAGVRRLVFSSVYHPSLVGLSTVTSSQSSRRSMTRSWSSRCCSRPCSWRSSAATSTAPSTGA